MNQIEPFQFGSRIVSNDYVFFLFGSVQLSFLPPLLQTTNRRVSLVPSVDRNVTLYIKNKIRISNISFFLFKDEFTADTKEERKKEGRASLFVHKLIWAA